MQLLKESVSRHLARCKPIWAAGQVFYRTLSGVYFVTAYHSIRIWRNRIGLRKHGAQALGMITRYFESAGVRPILNCGTLLAYIRQGQIDRFSKDIDLAIFADELKNPRALVEYMTQNGYRLRMDGKMSGALRTIGEYHLLQFHHPKKHVSIDICFLHRQSGQILFFEDRGADYLYRDFLREKKHQLGPYIGYCRRFDERIYGDLESADFCGSRIWVPKDPEGALRIMYGPDIRSGKKNILSNLLIVQDDTPGGKLTYVDLSQITSKFS